MRSIQLNRPWVKVLLHVLIWVAVFSLPTLLRPYNPNNNRNPDEHRFLYLSFLTGFLWVALFYLNSEILIQKILYKRKYVVFILVNIAVYALIIFLHSLIFKALIHSRPFMLRGGASFNLSAFLLTVAASIIYRNYIDNERKSRLAQEKQQENLKTELGFLRSQISPHFIFNVLNNIVALARMKSEQLEPTVMKLSSLMQYMLYETDEDRVSLQTETEYLESYVDLQKQRFGSKVKVNLITEVRDGQAYIEPMLLIPFVENAFKHGVGMIENPEINIKLESDDLFLRFNVQNKFITSSEVKDKTSGIGLPNVTRRLNLLYPGQHDLMITKDAELFSVSLKIKLH